MKYLALNLKEGDEAFLKLYHGYVILGLTNRKLTQQRVGPFKVQAKVGHLVYRLQLPPVIRIHPVVSVAQLEPSVAVTRGLDPYGRIFDQEPPPVINDESELERILGKRTTGSETEYLIKWKDYGN